MTDPLPDLSLPGLTVSDRLEQAIRRFAGLLYYTRWIGPHTTATAAARTNTITVTVFLLAGYRLH